MRRARASAAVLLALWMLPGSGAGAQVNDEYSLRAAEAYGAAQAVAPAPAAVAAAPALAASAAPLDPRDRAYSDYRRAQDDYYFRLSTTVSGIALAVLLFIAWASRRTDGAFSSRDLVRAGVVVFLAYGSIVLALAYPEPQVMTGVIGILSTIAGYVFGRTGSDDRTAPPPPPPPSPAPSPAPSPPP